VFQLSNRAKKQFSLKNKNKKKKNKNIAGREKKN